MSTARVALAALVLLTATDALAARHEVSGEFVANIHEDAATEVLTDAPVLPGGGLRGGGAVLVDRKGFGVVVDGGWTHAQRGAFREGGSYRWADRLSVDTVFAGAKVDFDVRNVFYPYVHARAGVAIGQLQLDDDRDRDDNPNQLRTRGVAPSGTFGLGFELMLPDEAKGWPVTPAFFLEAGYMVSGPMRLGDVGSIDLSGVVVRSGVGLRFR